MTTTPQTDTLRINAMHLDGQMGDASNWSTHEMKNVYTNMNFSTTVDSNGTIVAGYFDTVDMDVEMLRLYTDSDRDLIFDRIDDMRMLVNNGKMLTRMVSAIILLDHFPMNAL